MTFFAATALLFAATWWFIYRLVIQPGKLQIRLEAWLAAAGRGWQTFTAVKFC